MINIFNLINKYWLNFIHRVKIKSIALRYFMFLIIVFIVKSFLSKNIFVKILTVRFYLDILYAFIVLIVIWETIKFISTKLDNRISWENNPKKRLIAQFSFTFLTSLLLIYLLYVPYSLLLYTIPLIKIFSPAQIIAALVVVSFFNIYFGWQYLFKKVKEKPVENETKVDKKTCSENTIMVHSGGMYKLINYDNIATIFIDAKYVFLKTKDKLNFLVNKNLDYYEDMLPSESFFRINRQLIAHRNYIQSFTNIENRKIDVFFLDDTHAVISQKKASRFKKWVENNFHQSEG